MTRERRPEMASSGQSRVHSDTTGPANDLRGVLDTRLTATQQQLAQTTEARRAEQLRADIHQLELDIAALRRGGSASGNMALIEVMARRHGVDPAQLRRNDSTRGDVQTQVSGASASGLGRTHSDVTQRDVMDDRGAGHATDSRSRTTALTENGLVRQSRNEQSVERGDGSTRTNAQSTNHTLGGVAGGIGYQRQTEATQQRQQAANDDGHRAGVQTSVQNTQQVALTGNGATAGMSQQRQVTRTRADGTSEERRATGGVSGNITTNDEGQVTGYSGTLNRGLRRTDNDAEGNATRQRSVNSSATYGRVSGENGDGTTQGITLSGSDASQRGSVQASGGLTRTQTDRQQASGGNVSLGGGGRAGGTFSLGGNSSTTINATPVRDSSPPTYDVTTTMEYDFTAGGSVGTNGNRLGASEGNRVAVSVGGEHREHRRDVFTHRMNAAEYARYQAAVAAASRGQGGQAAQPEVIMMARIAAANQQRRTPTEAELHNDPSIARNLRAGSAIEHGRDTRDQENVAVSGTGGPVTAGFTARETRTGNVVHRDEGVMVDGRRMIDVTITIDGSTERSRGAHAALEGVGGQITATRGESAGRTVVVRLDPSSSTFDRDYREAHAVADIATAEALARRTGSAITHRSGRTSGMSGGVGTMEDGQVSTGLTRADTHAENAEITVGRRDAQGRQTLSGTTTGQSGSTMGVSVRGTQVLQAGDTSNGTATTNENGEIAIQASNTERSGIVTPAWLESRWSTMSQRLTSIDISESDLNALVGRAGNNQLWQTAPPAGPLLHVQGPWNELRARLLNPGAAREWVAVNREVANKIARGQAITDYIGRAEAPYGNQVLRAILRDADPTRPLGTQWEWPNALRAEQRRWTSLHTEVQGARERFEAMTDEQLRSTAVREATRISVGLQEVKAAIWACGEFEEASAKVEMVAAIDADIRRIMNLPRQVLSGRTTGATNAAAAQPANAQAAQSGQGAQAAQAPAAQPQTATPEQQQAEARQARLQALADKRVMLQGFKRTEREHFGRAQNAATQAQGRIFLSPDGDVRTALDELARIEVDWVGRWGNTWREYRRDSEQLQQPITETAPYRINTHWRIELANRAISALGGTTRGIFEGNQVERTARWQQQDRDNP